MQPDTEDTSAQYDAREGAYVLAMDSILELLRTQDSKDRDAIIQKTTLLLHVADVFEPFITLYNLVGREINMLRLSLQALGLRVAISKRDATRRMKREEVRARPPLLFKAVGAAINGQ